MGLGSRRVKAIAAAKHHTVIATESGEVFTWGSNRGKLLVGILTLTSEFEYVIQSIGFVYRVQLYV